MTTNLEDMAEIVEAAIRRIEAGNIDAILAGMMFQIREGIQREQEATEEVDEYNNPVSGDRLIYCCFPDCGCAGARNCDAESGANNAAITLNREKTSHD